MEHGRRRGGSGRDRISGLPDELLHVILRHFRSAAAAARTSALSRRWRRVWTQLPELVLGDDLFHRGAAFLDAVDGALAAYSAAPGVHVEGLEIAVPYRCQEIPASRVAPWMRFASQRLAGAFDLLLLVPLNNSMDNHQWKTWPHFYLEEDQLDLPPCERATSIRLRIRAGFLLRFRQTGVFRALTDLTISANMEGRELEVLVSSMLCPCQRNLSLHLTLVAASDIPIRSESLRHLNYQVQNTRRLDVAAPMLQMLDVSDIVDAYIAASNMSEVVWGQSSGQVVFADAGHQLRLLDVSKCSVMAPLMRRFDTADELRLHDPGSGAYEKFLDDTNDLPKCETLWVSSSGDHHGIVPSVLHLLRRGNGIKRLLVSVFPFTLSKCLLDCPCRLPESSIANDIILDSPVIEIDLLGRSEVELIEQAQSVWRLTELAKL